MRTDEYKEKNAAELVELYRNTTNQEVFKVIYERYRTLVFKQIKTYVKDKNVAEDLVHDLFVKLQTHLIKYNNQSRFETWLYSFTRNFTIDFIRKLNKQKLLETAQSQEFDEEDEDTEIALKVEKLAKIMDQLSPQEKEILILKYGYGWQMDEIAEHLALNLSATKMRIKRAKQKAHDLYIRRNGK